MMLIYHITSTQEARRAAESGQYVPEAFSAEGFIHCSYVRQVCTVANSRFKGRTDLLLIEIDRGRLSCEVVDENLEGGSELFPHIYGSLPLSAIVRIHQFPCDETGCFQLPVDISLFATGPGP